MLPNNEFSSLKTKAQRPNYGVPLPPPIADIASVSIGGEKVGEINETYAERWWTAYQDADSDVKIRGAVGEAWGEPISIFNEPQKILDLCLTFDQLGRPTVFYQLQDGFLYLFWYDPVAGEQTIAQISSGSSPRCIFDYPLAPSNPNSDIILSYITPSGEIVYRYQRDRYGTEYPTGVSAFYITELYKDVRNRLQWVYIE